MSDATWRSRSSVSPRSEADRGGRGRHVLAECPLPIAGLLSDAPLEDVIAQSRECNEAAHALGWVGRDAVPDALVSRLSVIPNLKITDRGLVDVDRFELVPLTRYEQSSTRTAGSSRWTMPAPSTRRAGCSSRTASSSRVGDGAEPEADDGSTSAARSSRPASSTPTTTCTRPSRAPGRSRRTSSPGCASSTRCGPRIDAEAEYAAARTGLAELALSGCTTVFDHHYVFPRGRTGLVEAEVQAARELGVRIVASRGSMDLGVSDGGLPPDELVEELDAVLADTERLAGELHEPGPGARVQIAVAPCSPFSVTRTADGGVGGARAPPRAAAAHASRRDARGGGVLPRALRLPPGRVPRPSSAGSRTTSGARTASTSPRRHRRFARRAPALRIARRRTSASAPASRRCAS